MSARFDIFATPLDGVRLVRRKPLGDARGYFERLFCASELEALTGGKRIEQVNHTLTVKRGTVRGMHFQAAPHSETKFVSCIRGVVFDVAVDLRPESPTYLHWHGETLSADGFTTLVVPDGCAHGFQTLVDDCELLYLHTNDYRPEADTGVNPHDPTLAIAWPEEITELSARDAALPFVTTWTSEAQL
jgi:dTDP-4-dehydrorhamnose 3,5-epimerase